MSPWPRSDPEPSSASARPSKAADAGRRRSSPGPRPVSPASRPTPSIRMPWGRCRHRGTRSRAAARNPRRSIREACTLASVEHAIRPVVTEIERFGMPPASFKVASAMDGARLVVTAHEDPRAWSCAGRRQLPCDSSPSPLAQPRASRARGRTQGDPGASAPESSPSRSRRSSSRSRRRRRSARRRRTACSCGTSTRWRP